MQTMGRKLIVLLTMISLFLIGCEQEQGPEEVYEAYLKAATVSYSDAQMEYCHFESEDSKETSRRIYGCVFKYEIISFEQLSDQLWVATTRTLATQHEDVWFTFTNFVGVVGGEYRVILNSNEVPEQLKDGIDLETLETFSTEPVA